MLLKNRSDETVNASSLHFIALSLSTLYEFERWTCLLKQQTSITVYRLWTKENQLQISICRKQTEVCRFRFPKMPFSVSSIFCQCVSVRTGTYSYLYLYLYFYLYAAVSNGKWKTEAQATFLNPLTICSSCKRKFVVCPFVDEETNFSICKRT